MLEAETFYRRYIACLNDRRLEALGTFVQDALTYNGEAMSLGDYQALIAGDVAAIPDLVFDVRMLVADGDRIACRLVFDCTPARAFLGFEPNGRRISFAEHVFYRLRDGKICEVWSLIDRPAIAAQLAP